MAATSGSLSHHFQTYGLTTDAEDASFILNYTQLYLQTSVHQGLVHLHK